MEQKAIIVGAGLVGSLWASYLANRGYTVTVYERRPDMRKTEMSGGRSINLALSDRGLKALAGAGITEEVKAMSIPMHGRLIHNEQGETNLQPYGLQGQYINSISRGGLNALLMDKAEATGKVTFKFNHKCNHVDSEEGVIELEDHNGQDIKDRADLIFGTDGAFSAVRNSIVKTDRFNYSQYYLEHGYKELTIPPAAAGGFRIEKNALHIWPRKRFMLIALPNQDGSFTVTLFLAFDGEPSFDKLNTEQEIKAFFEEYFPDAIKHMPDLLEDFAANPTSSLVTVRCYPWAHANKVLLMGDASHAIVPFYGQGMNAGFEDCTVLNDLLNEHGEDWPKVMELFQQQRKADADAIADLAMRNFIEMRDLVADDRFVLRKKVEKLMHQAHPDQFLPLYSMVTFSHIPYDVALRQGKLHDAYFEKLDDEEMLLVVERPDSAQAKSLLESWMSELKHLQA